MTRTGTARGRWATCARAPGVPGGGRSNLNPPSLFAVSLALGQVGVALLVRERLGSARRAVVTWINTAAMSIYLWHQTALITVTVLMLRLAGTPVPGLHTAPGTPAWLAARLGWLPVFGAVLRARSVELLRGAPPSPMHLR